MLEKTYYMAESPPPPMDWAQYERIILDEWSKLMDNKLATEDDVQAFLERHPCMVPGAFGLIGTSGHYPHPAALISQPILPDYNFLQPDFMWLATDSCTWYPVLIEIEGPSKRWFTKRQQTAELTQAITQLVEWRTWFENPTNILRFKQYYQIEKLGFNQKAFRPLYVLVFGRREEATHDPRLAKMREHLQGEDRFFMTYDRLRPRADFSEFWCVQQARDGWLCVSVPPTATLGPSLAPIRVGIRGREEAILKNPYLANDRKTFLISRLAYWDKWAADGSQGVISGGDRE